jgi:hypothetical protein
VVTNAGTLTIAGSYYKELAGTLINAGTIAVTGTGTIYAAAPGTTTANQAGATFDFQADGGLSNSNYTGTAFNNAGTLRKSAGTTTSFVGFPLNNTAGAVAVASGIFSLQAGGSFSGTSTLTGALTLGYDTDTLIPVAHSPVASASSLPSSRKLQSERLHLQLLSRARTISAARVA